MPEANDYIAMPESGSGPGLLVLHAWWGLTDFFKTICDGLAQQGYVVLAPDLFGGATTSDRDEAEQLAGPLFNDFASTSATVTSAVARLQAHPAVSGTQIGMLGFSLGAFWAQEVAVNHLPDAVRAVVLFYGIHPGLEAQQYAASSAAFQGHFAEDDEFDPWEAVLQTQDRHATGRHGRHILSISGYDALVR